jgi:hypothetical protein
MIDFDRHTEVFEAAYQWCNSHIDKLVAEHNPALDAILGTKPDEITRRASNH